MSIGLHPILDINKTERQLRVLFKDMADPVVIGNTASKKLLIGVFIKNEPYGLRHAKFSLGSKQNKLIDIVTEYFASYLKMVRRSFHCMRRPTDMDNSEVKKRLNSINWNFDFTIDYGEDALHPFNCRKYYSYPATFIPEIPYALIEILSQKGMSF